MQDVLEAFERLSRLVDDQAWEAAADALRDYDASVRNAHARGLGNEAEWRAQLQRHRLLSLRMASGRDDADRALGNVRRARSATTQYLRAVPA